MHTSAVRWITACAVIAAGIACHAQSTTTMPFPGKPGHWEATMTSTALTIPMTTTYCLNDDTWQGAFLRSKTCQMSNFQKTSSGAKYDMDCKLPNVDLQGQIEMSFDGKEHFVETGNVKTTARGQTTDSSNKSDVRWKSSTCTGEEINMRQRQR